MHPKKKGPVTATVPTPPHANGASMASGHGVRLDHSTASHAAPGATRPGSRTLPATGPANARQRPASTDGGVLRQGAAHG